MISVYLKTLALMLRAKLLRVLYMSCVDKRLKEMEVSILCPDFIEKEFD